MKAILITLALTLCACKKNSEPKLLYIFTQGTEKELTLTTEKDGIIVLNLQDTSSRHITLQNNQTVKLFIDDNKGVIQFFEETYGEKIHDFRPFSDGKYSEFELKINH
jgi:sucrose-6-phosphate hydrolase SacC (GH32 family)